MSRLIETYALLKRRQRRRAARRRSLPQRLLRVGAGLLGALSLLAALVALAAWPLFQWLAAGMPPVTRLAELMDAQTGELLQPTYIYDRTGTQIWAALQPPGVTRQFTSSQNPYLAQAFVASQQPDYWQAGERPWWLLDERPGGIAENLAAKLLLAEQADGWAKTLRARLLANEALSRYGPQQILVWALDSADFGYWTFGQESAAQLYFGKPAGQLTLGQAALLAAVAQAPALNPFDAPELARAYQRLVLTSMLDQDMISPAEFDTAFAEDLQFAAMPAGLQHPSSFLELLVSQLEAELGYARLHAGGLRVTSTLDAALQQEIEGLGDKVGEVAVLDPINGQMLALHGAGRAHPAAEMLLPFSYLEVFAMGYSPASLVWDLPAGDEFEAGEYLGPTTLRAALAAGLLRPVQPLLDPLGPTRAAEDLAAFGWQPGQDATTIDVAAAYGVLAARGLRAGQGDPLDLQLSTVLFVADAQNRVLLNWTVPQFSTITSADLAYLVSDVLADASQRPPEEQLAVERPLAFFSAGGWALGYSPQRVVAVWGDMPATVLAAAYDAAHRDLPLRAWEAPASLVAITVCVPSGQLPDEDCPQRRRELFLPGTQPTMADTLFERVALSGLNGQLATVFTPQEFVRQQLFLRLPEAATAWAEAAGIPQPPERFDTLSPLNVQTVSSRIARPEAFAVVGGALTLLAELDEAAEFYEIQVGQGLWPDEWISLAEGRKGSGDQVRAAWDTSGLSGLWAIQLQTLDAEGVLQRTYSIVTIEN
ncbi:MAG: transglycosylase domain-containing protein [Anaerolineales bacterium]|nr:transglycosylase domain-containing protein [Anaerolineales bacterium]